MAESQELVKILERNSRHFTEDYKGTISNIANALSNKPKNLIDDITLEVKMLLSEDISNDLKTRYDKVLRFVSETSLLNETGIQNSLYPKLKLFESINADQLNNGIVILRDILGETKDKHDHGSTLQALQTTFLKRYVKVISRLTMTPVLYKLLSLEPAAIQQIVQNVDLYIGETANSLKKDHCMNLLEKSIYIQGQEHEKDTKEIIDLNVEMNENNQVSTLILKNKVRDILGSKNYRDNILKAQLSSYIYNNIGLLQAFKRLSDIINDEKNDNIRKAIDAALKETITKRILTFIKIRCDSPPAFNTQFNVSTNENKNTLVVKYNDFATKEGTSTSVHINITGKQILIPEKYEHEYVIGPITKVFDPAENNKNIAEQMEAVITNLTNKKPVLIIGYGASGAGKTSTLVYYDGKDGVVVHLCQIMANSHDYKTLKVSSVNIYGDPHYNADTENRTDETEFTFDKSKGKFVLTKNNKEEDLGSFVQDIIMNAYKRQVDPTPNNIDSSRSHVLVFIKFGNFTNEENPLLILGDFAGVENSFACESETVKELFIKNYLKKKKLHKEGISRLDTILLMNKHFGDNCAEKDDLILSDEDKKAIDTLLGPFLKMNDIDIANKLGEIGITEENGSIMRDLFNATNNEEAFLETFIDKKQIKYLYKNNYKGKKNEQAKLHFLIDQVGTKEIINLIKKVDVKVRYSTGTTNNFVDNPVNYKSILLRLKCEIDKMNNTKSQFKNNFINNKISDLTEDTFYYMSTVPKGPWNIYSKTNLDVNNCDKYIILESNENNVEKGTSNDFINKWQSFFSHECWNILNIKFQDLSFNSIFSELKKFKEINMIFINNLPRYFKHIRQLAVMHSCQQQFIHDECNKRRNEGFFINKSLSDARDVIRQILLAKNENNFNKISPLFIESCLSHYCEKDNEGCFNFEKKSGELSSVIFDKILEQLRHNVSFSKEVTADADINILKDLVICVFCVFNISENAQVQVPYIDINKVRTILAHRGKSKGVIDDNLWTNIQDAIGKFKTYSNVALLVDSFKENINKRKYSLPFIKDILNSIDRNNAASVIGTLQYVDSLAKFTTTDTLCSEQTMNNEERELFSSYKKRDKFKAIIH